jgi:predicted alpha/beta superfamily hydrolase
MMLFVPLLINIKLHYLKYLLELIVLFFCFNSNAQYTVTIKATVSSLSNKDKCYVAGNHNQWNPKEEASSLVYVKGKELIAVLKNVPSNFEYKITKGNWATVECAENEHDIENRKIQVNSDTIISIQVAYFKSGLPKNSDTIFSTRSARVSILNDSFFIPQLKKKRAIWIYKPKNYDAHKKYPVLYMHDGQNLFDKSTSGFGEWGIDEYLDSMQKEIIIVGIDHGGTDRLSEYNPYDNKAIGKGAGKAYVDFIVKTLKPFIDKQLSILTNKENTFIAGSSMGAHISLYAALQYPTVFGKVGIFSPAFWVNMPQVKKQISRYSKIKNQFFYFYCGQQESTNLVKEVIEVFNLVKAKTVNGQCLLSIKANGKHNEASWQQELPHFFEWLLK